MNSFRYTEESLPVLEQLPQPMAVYRTKDGQVYAKVFSRGFCELFGYEETGTAVKDMNADMFRHTHPDDIPRLNAAIAKYAQQYGKFDVYYRTKRRDGVEGYRIIHATGETVDTENGERTGIVWFMDEGPFQDIPGLSEEAAFRQTLNNMLREESMIRANRYDGLTGLPGMSLFFQLAAEKKKELLQENSQPVLLFFNMSGMKHYNARNGFTEGDKLLLDFSRLLSRTFGMKNCCRIGADHFLAIGREEGLEETLDQLFRETETLNEGVSLPVHTGIYPFRIERASICLACDRAKYACDAIRMGNQSQYRYYDIGMREKAEMRHYILTHLDQALEEKWIHVYYQPIVRAVNGMVCDEEALSRWVDPELGILPPAEFIPPLEEAGIIYRLDLYVLDRVLEKIQRMERESLYVVPQSVNLSRSDFDMVDMAEEVRKRVDAAGVDRGKITIEITESVLGEDYEYMKKQILRFQEMGFRVWLDDFGSGYSSLDVLESIRFDLLKFDMSFIRKLDEGDNSKIVLTDLIKMATEMGVETVCEGVESENQAMFLREIGCAKLQGFFYERPISLETILERFREGTGMGFENPQESDYFAAIGRVNLYDLAVISGGEDSFQNVFNTLPMSIIEVQDNMVYYTRANQPYRDFMKRFFGYDLSKEGSAFPGIMEGPGSNFLRHVKECCRTGRRTFTDEMMPDGSIVHSFIRRVGVNPVTDRVAVAVAVLSVTDVMDGGIYASIARSMAAEYYHICYVNLENDRFIEYSNPNAEEEAPVENRGEHFFEVASEHAREWIHEADRERMLSRFTKENIIRGLNERGSVVETFRMTHDDQSMLVRLKITRAVPDNRYMVIGVSILG